jgi:hypothetical protein
MTGADLLQASRREHALYGELLAVYRGLHAVLGDEATPVDPVWIGGEHARAERVAAELRALAAALAPQRMTGAAVAPEAKDIWRATAEVAAQAASANRELTTLARARQAAVATRLAGVHGARRGLAAYRPVSVGRSRFADERA